MATIETMWRKACLLAAFGATVIVAQAAEGTGPTPLRAIYTKPGELDMLVRHGHAQGAACSERAIYVSHSGGIVKLDWSGHVVKSVAARTHLGDIAYADGRIYGVHGVYGSPDGAKGESRCMVTVWDDDLNFVTNRFYDHPGARGFDGAVVLDGVLYTCLDAHWDGKGRYDHPPHRDNAVVAISTNGLSPMGTRDIVFDYPIHFSPQTLGTDGRNLFFGNYGAKRDEGNTNGLCFTQATPDLKPLANDRFYCPEGFCLVPKAVSGRDDPVFLKVTALGGNMQGWRKDPRGNPPRIRLDFFAFDPTTGSMTNITDYSTSRAADVALFRHRCAAAGQKGAFRLGKATSMENLRPRDGALPKVATTLFVRLAQGEDEAVQLFVVAAEGDLRNVKVAVNGDLVMQNAECRMQNDAPRQLANYPTIQLTNSFAATNVAACVLGYVNITNRPPYGRGYNVVAKGAPGYERKSAPCETGWWPDPILTYASAADVVGDDVQGFWIRVHAPDNQKAGLYEGRVTVSADGVEPVDLPFTVRVNGFAVPKTPMLPLAITFRRWQYESTKAWTNGLADIWADFAADYKLPASHLYMRKPDFDQVERLRARGGSPHYNLCHWDPPKTITNEAHIAEWRTNTLGAIKANYAVAKARGLLEGAYIYGCDELWPKDFERIAWAAGEIRRAIPDVPVMTTARDGAYGVGTQLAGIDWFAPVTAKYSCGRAEKARAEGRQVWWYFACDQVPPYANSWIEGQAIEMRSLMGAQTVKYRPDGFLYYYTTSWLDNKPVEGGPFLAGWNPCSWGKYHGDGNWTVRGPGDIPLPTIRLENYRDGLEDYAYAKLLEQKLQKLMQNAECRMQNDAGGSQSPATDSPATDCNRQPAAENQLAAGEPPAPRQLTNNPTNQLSNRASWAQRAQEALAVPREVVDSVGNFTDDPAALYRWRDKMADLIEAR